MCVSRFSPISKIEERLTKVKTWQTLSAFIREARLSPDAGSVEKGDLTIEKILEEKSVFDLTLRFEKTGLKDGENWTLPGRMYLSVCSFPSKCYSQLPQTRNKSLRYLPLRTYCMSLSTSSKGSHLSNCYLLPQQTDNCIS